MNKTKWNELSREMYRLALQSPRWRTRDLESGYISDWDGDWFYHFSISGFSSIEWVEIKTDNSSHHELVKTVLRRIHLPADELESGFKIYGYVPEGTFIDYL